jgi:hypothetical protein
VAVLLLIHDSPSESFGSSYVHACFTSAKEVGTAAERLLLPDFPRHYHPIRAPAPVMQLRTPRAIRSPQLLSVVHRKPRSVHCGLGVRGPITTTSTQVEPFIPPARAELHAAQARDPPALRRICLQKRLLGRAGSRQSSHRVGLRRRNIVGSPSAACPRKRQGSKHPGSAACPLLGHNVRDVSR